MEYYREYIEVDDPAGHYVAEVRLCHDYPMMALGDHNQVAVFDEAAVALMAAEWMADAGMPTDSWAVPVMA